MKEERERERNSMNKKKLLSLLAFALPCSLFYLPCLSFFYVLSIQKTHRNSANFTRFRYSLKVTHFMKSLVLASFRGDLCSCAFSAVYF